MGTAAPPPAPPSLSEASLAESPVEPGAGSDARHIRFLLPEIHLGLGLLEPSLGVRALGTSLSMAGGFAPNIRAHLGHS